MKKKRGVAIPRVHHEAGKPGTNWLAVAVAVVSLGIQAGMAFRWGGKTDAVASISKEILDRHESRITEVEKHNARQDTAIASDQGAGKVAYTDIARRLASIEQKVDELNQRR